MLTGQLLYFIEKSFQNIRHFLLINLITMGIISLSLIVLSTFLLVFLNLQSYLDTWRSQIQVTAYLADSVTEEQRQRLEKDISALPEVTTITYTSKQDAVRILNESFPEQSAALTRLTKNPLPASIDIQVKPEYQALEPIKYLAATVERLPGVQEVDYGRSWIEGYELFLRFLKTAALAVGTVIVLATIFIISNTIKLTVYARKEEIEIMRLVGATNSFIRTPFFLEGVLQGMAGAVTALGVLALCFHFFTNWITQLSLFPFHLVKLSFFPWEYILLIIAGGMLTGLLGSFFSLGRYLRI